MPAELAASGALEGWGGSTPRMPRTGAPGFRIRTLRKVRRTGWCSSRAVVVVVDDDWSDYARVE
jgi:hypothetical protein